MSVQECANKLRAGSPRIEVLTGNNPSTVPGVHESDPKTPRPRPDALRIISMTLQPGEDVLVGRRLREVLSEARKAV
jgi:L-seryl-tRNA(Ser) seleniumtransferase